MIEKFVDVEIKTFQRNRRCNQCETDLMNYDTNAPMLMSMPPQFKHVCDKCGWSEHLTEKYPTVVYKNIT